MTQKQVVVDVRVKTNWNAFVDFWRSDQP